MSYLKFSAKDIHKVVPKLSLQKTQARRAKHPMYRYLLDGKVVNIVKLPNIHGGKNDGLSTGFLNQIKNSFKLNSDQFEDLISCPMTAEEYERIFRDKLHYQSGQ